MPKNSGNHVRARKLQREILEFMWHPEHKSLGPDGQPCNRFTRGLLQRTPVLAGELIPVGKETDRKWEDGEDISILDRSMIHYMPKKAKADAETIQGLSKIPLRQQMRDTGLSHHTLLLIQRGKVVKKKTLQTVKEYLKVHRRFTDSHRNDTSKKPEIEIKTDDRTCRHEAETPSTSEMVFSSA